MKTIPVTQPIIPRVGAFRANNIHPNFIGADGKSGTTVIKHIHSKVYEEVRLMFIMRLNYHTFSTDNHLTRKDEQILYPFGDHKLDLSNKYEITRKGNSFYVQKINGKGKVFQFTLHVSVENGNLKYRYVWKKRLRDLVGGKKVKMRMFASQQLGINLMKLYQTVAA